MSKASLRQAILQAKDLEERVVSIPQWIDPETGRPVVVVLRALTGFEMVLCAKIARDSEGNVDGGMVLAEQLILSMREPIEVPVNGSDGETRMIGGELLFSRTDRDELLGKVGGAIDWLTDIVADLTGSTAAKKAELEKNSGTIQPSK